MWVLGLGCAIAALGATAVRADTPAAPPPPLQEGAPASEPSAGTPRIEFPVSSIDFGRQLAGEDLKTTFSFKNTGDGVLHILGVKGG
jgi:hypothetical protein